VAATTAMSETYKAYKARVEELVEHMVATTTVHMDPRYRELVEHAMRGGKRIRPILALSMIDHFVEVYETRLGAALSPEVRRQVELTCLVSEVVHSASLVVDDLPCMDNATERRGMPSLHARFGEAAAILTSGHLLTLVSTLYTSCYHALRPHGFVCAENYMDLVAEVSRCMSFEGACAGQMMDLRLVPCEDPTCDDTMYYKTATFFHVALLTGVLVCGKMRWERHALQKLEEAARGTGVAFQIYDDFTDAEEDRAGGSTNYVNDVGHHAALARFDENYGRCDGIMRELGVHTEVFKDIMDTMRAGILRRLT